MDLLLLGKLLNRMMFISIKSPLWKPEVQSCLQQDKQIGQLFFSGKLFCGCSADTDIASIFRYAVDIGPPDKLTRVRTGRPV